MQIISHACVSISLMTEMVMLVETKKVLDYGEVLPDFRSVEFLKYLMMCDLQSWEEIVRIKGRTSP